MTGFYPGWSVILSWRPSRGGGGGGEAGSDGGGDGVGKEKDLVMLELMGDSVWIGPRKTM